MPALFTSVLAFMLVSAGIANAQAGADKDPVKPHPIPVRTTSKQALDANPTCQPEGPLFPSSYTLKSKKRVSKNGTAYRVGGGHIPKIEGFEVRVLRVDCDLPEGVDPSEEPESSYVYELLSGGKRKALYTHVERLEEAPNGNLFFIDNAVKRKGKWERRRRIVNLKATSKRDRKTFVAASTCDRFDSWHPNSTRFIMLDGESADDVCVFDARGTLLHHWTIPLRYHGPATTIVVESLLWLRGDLLIHTGDAPGDSDCRADVIDLSTGKVASRTYEQEPCNFKPLRALVDKKTVTSFATFKAAMKQLGPR